MDGFYEFFRLFHSSSLSFFLPRFFHSEPMDPLLFEQHFRAPLRFFPDSMLAQFAAHAESESASAALLEKARQHLQMIGRAPYPAELLLPQMYQRPPNFSPLNLGLWQNQLPPQLSAGFLSAAAFANAIGNRGPSSTMLPTSSATSSHIPLQMAMNQIPGTQSTSMIAPPSSSSSSDSSSPDLRVRNFARFSPYPLPNRTFKGQQSSSSSSSPPPSSLSLPPPSSSSSPFQPPTRNSPN